MATAIVDDGIRDILRQSTWDIDDPIIRPNTGIPTRFGKRITGYQGDWDLSEHA
jgi:hypothetical protein